MSAPQEKQVVVAVKTISQQPVAHAPVVKSSVVKTGSTLVKKSLTTTTTPAGPKKTIAKKAPSSAISKTSSSGTTLGVKRPISSNPKVGGAAGGIAKKPKVAGQVTVSKPKSAPIPGVKKVVKKIAGDDCTVEEPRSEDSSDEGSIGEFLVDDDDEEDGYDDEEEMKKVEDESFTLGEFEKHMKDIRMMFSSSAKRNKYLAEHPEVLKEDLTPKKK